MHNVLFADVDPNSFIAVAFATFTSFSISRHGGNNAKREMGSARWMVRHHVGGDRRRVVTSSSALGNAALIASSFVAG